MTRTTVSGSKGHGHQAALLTAVLARQAAAVVGVRTCWPWETAATLPSARRRKALRCLRGEERGEAYVAAARLQLVLCRNDIQTNQTSVSCSGRNHTPNLGQTKTYLVYS